MAGGNNSGKSTLLQGLAVWEFCKVATVAQRDSLAICADQIGRQGFGLGDDEFSPINIPSLRHLWTNLKPGKQEGDPDGYTLSITCEWEDSGAECKLGFSLSLANDRLFIRVSESTVEPGDRVPVVAYLPPFAGISAREQRVYGALRRRRIGEGLAGAVLRNILLDMKMDNAQERAFLRAGKTKISDRDLKNLRETDPWELLQAKLREVFNAEVDIRDFNEEYHTYIQANVTKGRVDGFNLKRYANYNPRDIMVEGSGFLQWLSVYALATSREVDVLLLDEPDAHLHVALQRELVGHLADLAERSGKQVLMGTHSTEALRLADPHAILHVKSGGNARYLREQHQKVGLFEGIGSDYAPKLDHLRDSKRIFFYEGTSDRSVLTEFATTLNIQGLGRVTDWQTTRSQKDRRDLWRAISEEVSGVQAFSLRDRDEEELGTVGDGLVDKILQNPQAGFSAFKWRRRHIEAYLLWPPALASASGRPVVEVETQLQETFGLAIGETYLEAAPPAVFLEVRAKEILQHFGVKPCEVARAYGATEIPSDVVSLLESLASFASVDGLPSF